MSECERITANTSRQPGRLLVRVQSRELRLSRSERCAHYTCHSTTQCRTRFKRIAEVGWPFAVSMYEWDCLGSGRLVHEAQDMSPATTTARGSPFTGQRAVRIDEVPQLSQAMLPPSGPVVPVHDAEASVGISEQSTSSWMGTRAPE